MSRAAVDHSAETCSTRGVAFWGMADLVANRALRRMCVLVACVTLVSSATWSIASAAVADHPCGTAGRVSATSPGPVMCERGQVHSGEGWGNVHFLVNGADPADRALVPPVIAPGDAFELTGAQLR